MITIEWQLYSGAGGMAAQWCHARIKGQLNRIAEQHKWQLELHPGRNRYTLRTELTEQQYTMLCLQWLSKERFEKWHVVSYNGSSKDVNGDSKA